MDFSQLSKSDQSRLPRSLRDWLRAKELAAMPAPQLTRSEWIRLPQSVKDWLRAKKHEQRTKGKRGRTIIQTVVITQSVSHRPKPRLFGLDTVNLQFSQDWNRDIDSILNAFQLGRPFALARFCDGEWAVMCQRQNIVRADRWYWQDGKSCPFLAEKLHAALAYSAEGWHIGITSRQIRSDCHDFLVERCGAPLSRVTIGELFMYSNYQSQTKFLNLDDCLVVGFACPIATPQRPDDTEWENYERIVDDMVAAPSRAIALCAGPWSAVLAHEYWQRTASNPAIRVPVVDFGSAVSVRWRKPGGKIRCYQRSTHPDRKVSLLFGDALGSARN